MPGDGEWPERLDGLDHVEPLNGMAGSPIALWAVGPRDLGELCQSRLPAVAIVGARAATHYGCDSANELAAQLAGQFPVISGGAYGIDAAAHRGAFVGGRAHCGGHGGRAGRVVSAGQQPVAGPDRG
ncbi:hypothetical protein FAM14222_000619 [Propionibacterium freudenreichii]|uniref:DNA-processing protein DprA n=1 Tax=Propionibacterium freudenreichii TaxID=1744 RepID=UPI002A177A98|nr:hypothetical protein [Propionibacterium freudenreichii]